MKRVRQPTDQDCSTRVKDFQERRVPFLDSVRTRETGVSHSHSASALLPPGKLGQRHHAYLIDTERLVW